MRLALLTAALLAAAAPPATLAGGPSGAPAPATAPGDPVRAARRTGELVLDGRLEEPAWDVAPAHDGFFQSFPREGQPPTDRTEVRVLYDDRALFVGIVCHDGVPSEVARPLGRRDNAPYGDSVVVLLDSSHDKRTAYWFELTAAGVQKDALLFGEDESNADWDAVWDGAAATLKDGWSAEFRIPLSVLRFSGARDQVWGFAVKRIQARTREELITIPLKRGDRGVVGRLADLTGLTGLEPVQELSLTPYLAARAAWRPKVDDGARRPPRMFDPSGDLGLDLRASLGRGLALQATVNPDFGQVEADQIMQNLSTFELFFPEKRPFFTQGMDLFQGLSPNDHRSPQQLFYSRRIGLDAPILGAAKLAGRVSDTLEVGLLEAAVMGAAAPAGAVPGQPSRRYRFEPAQPLHFGLDGSLPQAQPAARNFLVGTARWQPAATATFRASAASVLPLERRCAAGDFDPAGLADPAGRCDALLGQAATLDASLRSAAGDWYARGQLSGSVFGGGGYDEPAGPTDPLVRTLPDGTVLRRGDTGWGAAVYAGRQGAEPWRFDGSWEYESPRLELNAGGYQRTQNEQLARGVLRYVRPNGGGPFHMYGFHLGGQGRWTTDGTGRTLGRGAWFSAEFQLRSFHYFGVDLNLDPAGDDVREIEGTGTAFRYAGSGGAGVWVSSDRGRPLWVEAWVSGGRTRATGVLPSVGYWATGWIVSVRPHPRLETRLDATYDHSRWPARWVEDQTAAPAPGAPQQHLFAALDAPSISVTLRQSLVLTPRLTLQAYAQFFSATGRYGQYYTASAPAGGRVRPSDLVPGGTPVELPDFRESALNLSAVLRWEYRLGSTLFLVYTRNAVEPDWPTAPPADRPPMTLRPRGLAQGPTTDTVLLKWSWFWAG